MYVSVLNGQQMRIIASTTIWHRRNSHKLCVVRDQAYLVEPMYQAFRETWLLIRKFSNLSEW